MHTAWRSTQKFSTICFVALLLFSCIVFVFPPQVHAQTTQPWDSPGSVCVGTGDAQGVATIQGIQCLLANVLSVAVSGIGLVGLVMMIVGAFKILLGGNSKGIEDGRNTITLAIVSLVEE